MIKATLNTTNKQTIIIGTKIHKSSNIYTCVLEKTKDSYIVRCFNNHTEECRHFITDNIFDAIDLLNTLTKY